MSALSIAILPVTEKGFLIAQGLTKGLPGARVFHPSGLKNNGLKRKIRRIFETYGGIVFISAAGIAVRVCAPLLKGKHLDPAVVVMDDAGRFAISLLSGHLGGANELAVRIAGISGAIPVITTATDAHGLPSAEEIAKKFNLAVGNVSGIKAVNSAILKGEKIAVIDSNKERRALIKNTYGQHKFFRFFARRPKDAKPYGAFFYVSGAADTSLEFTRRKTLVLHPRQYVVGIGCRRGVTQAEVDMAFTKALGSHGILEAAVRNLATIDIKKTEKGLVGFAAKRGFLIEFIDAERLNKIRLPS
ncbi:MAG: cobalamin biosynthesis protein, partial [Deltaproteobacteria bacterium]